MQDLLDFSLIENDDSYDDDDFEEVSENKWEDFDKYNYDELVCTDCTKDITGIEIVDLLNQYCIEEYNNLMSDIDQMPDLEHNTVTDAIESVLLIKSIYYTKDRFNYADKEEFKLWTSDLKRIDLFLEKYRAIEECINKIKNMKGANKYVSQP